VGGFVLVIVVGQFQAIPNPERAGEGIGLLAVLFAVAAGLDGRRRRAPEASPARCDAGGAPLLPPAATAAGDRPIVFRPQREAMLIPVLVFGTLAAIDVLGVGIREPVRVRGVEIPGPVAVGFCVITAALYLGLFIRGCLPGREIIVDTSGIVLPCRRRVTWDQITEVKLCHNGAMETLAVVRIGLNDGRCIRLRSYLTGGAPRKVYEAVQSCFAEHERLAALRSPAAEQQGTSPRPPVAAPSA
jgi:hypothetical protein